MAHGSKTTSKPIPPQSDTMFVNADAQPGSVNRKKQKRRQKQAQKQAAQDVLSVPHVTSPNAPLSNGSTSAPPAATSHPAQGRTVSSTAAQRAAIEQDDEDYDTEEDDDATLSYNAASGISPNGMLPPPVDMSGKKKSRKKKKGKATQPGVDAHVHDAYVNHSTIVHHANRAANKDRIWNTSTQEERERIKEFWSSLSEGERKSLVKIEKDAVLKKMKEQQKHSCSCSLCGRKRNAIEEELEVLYDAYYDELEQYAYDVGPGDPGQMLPYERGLREPPRLPTRSPIPLPGPHDRTHEPSDDAYSDDEEADDEDAEYSDDYEEDDYSQESSDSLRDVANDFLQLGNSLTVKGGILTVADDLLRNDGKKFIEMMEQMAERRMQREQEALVQSNTPYNGHDHGPQDEEDFDEEDEEDYDSQEDQEEEDDEPDLLTEKQRMEEGRRMFQIFAARMFEQRVLTAYREKVAAERQAKLIEELEDEKSHDAQREAKKQRDAQKRKEKKQQQKQAKAEEKARKDADKKAEEETAKRLEAEKQEEARRKREEAKRRKEAERKALEAEKAKKEAERLKRQQDERDRQQEVERKARELKAQKEKAKDDARRKAQEEQDAKEREVVAKRERKAEAEKERRTREDKVKADKIAQKAVHDKAQAEKSAQKAAQDKAIQDKAQEKARRDTQKRTAQVASVAVPPSLQRNTSNVASPHISVATPALSKAPTPVRKTASQQDSKGSSPKTPSIFTNSGKSASPLSVGSQQPPMQILPKLSKPLAASNSSNIMSPNVQTPLMHNIIPPPGMPPLGFGIPHNLNGFSQNRAPPGFPDMALRNGHMGPMYQNQLPPGAGLQYPLNSMPQPPPGIPGPPGRGFGDLQNMASQLPQMPHPPGFGPPGSVKSVQTPQHGRQASGSSGFESAIGQPIQRPAPIGRPGSVKPHEHLGGLEVGGLSQQLGSSALLDDADDFSPSSASRGVPVPSMTRGPSNLSGFGAPGLFPPGNSHGHIDPFGMRTGNTPGTSWTSPGMAFGNSAMSPAHTWSQTDRSGWPSAVPTKQTNLFGSNGVPPQTRSRTVQIRINTCVICRNLISNKAIAADGFIELITILRHLEPVFQPAPSAKELIAICETEGTVHNGAANFTIQYAEPIELARVRLDDISNLGGVGFGGSGLAGINVAVGDIGSPSLGTASSVPSANGPIAPPGMFPGLGANVGSGHSGFQM